MKKGFFKGAARRSKRYREIVTILARYGFSDFVRAIKLDKHFPFLKKIMPKRGKVPLSEFTLWEHVRMVFEELGPTYIKLAQIISSRRDLLPEELVKELEKLQDRVAPFATHQAVEIVEAELGRPLDEFCASFDEEPSASASIAQVHRATLRSGEEVVLKVRRPGIEETVRRDIEILSQIAGLMERFLPHMDVLGPSELVDDFEQQITKELDFGFELWNMERFVRNFRGDPDVRIPKTYQEYSGKRVLTMEYIDGKKISSLTAEGETEEDRRALARRIGGIYLKQIYEHGFFHGDPHPGNIFVLQGGVVCFLDFGIVGSLSRGQQEKLFLMMFGIMRRDPERVARAVLDLARHGGSVDREEFAFRVGRLMSRYLDLPLEYIDIQKILLDLVRVIVQFRLRLPTNLTLLIKVLVTVESIGMELDPDFRVITLIESFSRRLFLQRFRPKEAVEDFAFAALEFGSLLRDLPHEARDLLTVLKSGRLGLELRHRGLPSLIDSFSRASTRIIFALILSALLISSSVIVLAGVPPLWRNIPIIGLTGYLIAGVIGFGLVLSLVIKAFRER